MLAIVAEGIIIPFLGTTLGSACVFFLRKNITKRVENILSGFAGGVMVAASFFSLILPSIEGADFLGILSFIPVSIGFLGGILFLVLIDMFIPYEEQSISAFSKNGKLVLAVTIHNLPEGMAVGIAFAGILFGGNNVALSGAMALSIGIALQNFPEGAIVSMPLKASGMSKIKAFVMGTLSGAIEPVGAFIVIFAASFFVPLMPYFLSFAAGAMFYVVIEELLPQKNDGKAFNIGTLSFALGFVLMMALDVALG